MEPDSSRNITTAIQQLTQQQQRTNQLLHAGYEQQRQQSGLLQAIRRTGATASIKADAIELGVLFLACLGVIVAVNPSYFTSKLIPSASTAARRVFGGDWDRAAKSGDQFNGSTVTGNDESSVTLETNPGSQIFFPGSSGKVEVIDNTSILVTVTEGGNTYQFNVKGLAKTAEGNFRGSQVIGLTGGQITIEQFNRGQAEKPLKGWVNAFLTGNVLTSGDEIRGTMSNPIQELIKGQESAGDYGVVNQDSGALGAYQVMPENVPGWSQQAIGQEITSEQFLANPQVQDFIVEHKLNEYLNSAVSKGLDATEACRYVASAWYSGDGDARNDPSAQNWSNGNWYPSIQQYTKEVCSN